ncbi:DUF3644 domain-containing protein [Streptobacillus ratti]|uniref:DUF3644 domain-containing protein n=1 Tax=Streptobacillus ratti TaxID=1720557 RepID=UPI000934826A|nr:DUF3644 domain-containing protein [Streptobacillus ratti]
MENNNIKLKDRLVSKSIEAFILGLEIYNKPTIKYRVEGFSFFICNAWELMLKAKIISDYGESEIYYKDPENRTIDLKACVKKLFPDTHGALRKNIEKIIKLRNTSTHFITEDYEYIYAPLFQACVLNYVEKIKEFHNKDMTDYIAQNFLTLSIKINHIDENEIKGKYTPNTVKKILKDMNNIKSEIENNSSEFAIPIQTNFFITKDKSNADLILGINKETTDKASIIKDIKNPNEIYSLTTNDVIKLVNKNLKRENLLLTIYKNGEEKQVIFNKYHFNLFIKFYDIKNNKTFSFHYVVVGDRYSYSQKLVDFITEKIIKKPNTIIEDLKNNIKK